MYIRKIFDYNSFSKNFSSVSTYTPHCSKSKYKPFINNDYGHIIKSNLKIINNSYLQKLIKFGTKFRLPSNNKIISIIKHLTYDLNLITYKVAISFSKPVACFNR